MPKPTTAPTASRPIRSGAHPTVAVVVVAQDDAEGLDRLLSSLAPQARLAEAEVVVAHSLADEATPFSTAHPGVRFYSFPVGTPLSRLRAEAMTHTDGDIVTLVESSRGPLPEDWLQGLFARVRVASERGNPLR